MAPRGASKKKTSSTKSTGAKKTAGTKKKAPARRGAKTTGELKPKKKAIAANAKGTKPAVKKGGAKAAGKGQSSGVGAIVQKAQSLIPSLPGVGRWISRTVS